MDLVDVRPQLLKRRVYATCTKEVSAQRERSAHIDMTKMVTKPDRHPGTGVHPEREKRRLEAGRHRPRPTMYVGITQKETVRRAPNAPLNTLQFANISKRGRVIRVGSARSPTSRPLPLPPK